MMPPPAPKSDPTNHERLLVLVVDDEIEIRKNLRRLLERGGYEVATVASSLHAIEALRELPNLACVIADQKMRGPSGVALLDYVAQERGRVGRILYTGHLSGDIHAAIGHRHSVVEKLAPWELLIATVAYEIERRSRVPPSSPTA